MPDQTPTRQSVPMSRAVRHHLPVVLLFLMLGTVAGYFYASSAATTYTSTARVLVNPSSGNPFVPTPASVRQDELTSLETEAQVVRSDEVLEAVAAQIPSVSTAVIERRLQVTVPPNTQILEISYTAGDPARAEQIANAVATAYLDNRARRFEEVNQARIDRVEIRTEIVVKDLRAATDAAVTENDAERLFQEQMANALRNELFSLRAQRTALENSEAPPGSVIAPAGDGAAVTNLTAMALPVGGALAGLALGCLLAVALERTRGVLRSVDDVEASGVPVVAAVPPPGLRDRVLRRSDEAGVDTAVRRLRATMLDLEPRPDVITMAPPGSGRSDAGASEAVAESFARAGHRVVLVRTDATTSKDSLGVDDRGLAQVLLYERLNVLDLLQPTVEPLLCLLSDGGFTSHSRELLVADRVRAVLSPLIETGHLVVIQSPGIDSAEGEAFLGAADLGVVVVRRGRTRLRALEPIAKLIRAKGHNIAALVLGRKGVSKHDRLPMESDDSDSREASVEAGDKQVKARR